MVKIDPSITPEKPSRRRMFTGLCVLVLGQSAVAGAPLIDALDLGSPWGGIAKGALVLVVPDLALFAAIAIWGKPGFLYLKGRVFAFLRRGLPPDRVGPLRYGIGLVMFILPIMFAWVAPYLGAIGGEPLGHTPLAIAGDVVFVASFFVLGGDFWDKIRSLFVREAVARFPQAAEA